MKLYEYSINLRQGRNFLIILSLALTCVFVLSFTLPLVHATTTLGSVSAIAPWGYVQRSSPPIQIFGVGATSNSGNTLNSININFTGTGFLTNHLLPLSTASASSGVGIYRDTGSVDDTYDAGDTPLALTTIAWSGTQVRITLSEGVPTTITGNYQWIVVIRTSTSIHNNDQIIATINANQITYSDSLTQPSSPVTTATMTALVGPITIQSNGSITPSGDPRLTTSDNILYQFTMDIVDNIIVQRSNVIIDGASHKLLSWQAGGVGITVNNPTSNVQIRNVDISGYSYGIHFNFCWY